MMTIRHLAAAVALIVAAPACADLCDFLYELELQICDSEYVLCMQTGPLQEPPAPPPPPPDREACEQAKERCLALATWHYLCCRGEIPPEMCELIP